MTESGREIARDSAQDSDKRAPAADSMPVRMRPAGSLRLAWIVAIVADAIQWGLPFLFGLGAFTPVDVGLDVVVMIVLTRLLGWHWAFVPTFAIELLPFVDLVPTWTAAVWLATRRTPKPS